MPDRLTITQRAFGVPGCLDPLNYKSRIIGVLENQSGTLLLWAAPFT
jgi:hypothetical protein